MWATLEDYDEEDVINIITEQAELNLKFRQTCADQSNCNKGKTELHTDNPEAQNDHKKTYQNQ